MADPISITAVLAVGGVRAMVKHHQRTRRNARLSKVRLIVTELADEGCDLVHFQQICKRTHAWFDTVEEQEVLVFLQQTISNPTIVADAKYLIGLYGRSETTRRFVDGAADLGTCEYLRKKNELAAAKDHIVVMVEAGYDLAELQQIAVAVGADDCWTEATAWDAANALYDNDTAKDAISGQAVELIVAYVKNPDAADLVNEVVGLGIEVLGNTGEVVEGAADLILELIGAVFG